MKYHNLLKVKFHYQEYQKPSIIGNITNAKILFFNNGRLEEEGKYEELIERSDNFRSFVL